MKMKILEKWKPDKLDSTWFKVFSSHTLAIAMPAVKDATALHFADALEVQRGPSPTAFCLASFWFSPSRSCRFPPSNRCLHSWWAKLRSESSTSLGTVRHHDPAHLLTNPNACVQPPEEAHRHVGGAPEVFFHRIALMPSRMIPQNALLASERLDKPHSVLFYTWTA